MQRNINCITFPFNASCFNVEITITTIQKSLINIHIIAIYRSPLRTTLADLLQALDHLHETYLNQQLADPIIILGDFNVNLSKESVEKRQLMANIIQDKRYTQLITQYTTDYRSQMDHIDTNVPYLVAYSGVLESYHSDHKPLFTCIKNQ